MAAEQLSAAGFETWVFDAMPAPGRKFLMAGKGGMNITHAEDLALFISRYGARDEQLAPLLGEFGPERLRAWMAALGIDSFVGSSGRVFPGDMKAAPLLRAWLQRLRRQGVRFFMRHQWQGWGASGGLRFIHAGTEVCVVAEAVVLALGGASWPRLGSTGAWTGFLSERGVRLTPFLPANCGFEVAWSEHLRGRCAGMPLKPVRLGFVDRDGQAWRQSGELVISEYGLEGGAVYALSAVLREAVAAEGGCVLTLDLIPDVSEAQALARLARPRGKQSLANFLRGRLRLDAAKYTLLRELATPDELHDPVSCVAKLKALPVVLTAARPLAEAISSAGGVCFSGLDERLMLLRLPGVFCAGEMLDWEAPTGGYLLTACFATGRAAGLGAAQWLRRG